MKHLGNRKQRQKKIIRILLLMLIAALTAAALTAYNNYQSRPGTLEKVWISESGIDYITVAWERPRNVFRYCITCDGRTFYTSGIKSEMKLQGLSEGKYYSILVRADSNKREGLESISVSARTRKSQHIEGESNQMKFVNTLVDLKQTSETDITYSSDDDSMKVAGDKVMFTKPGKYSVIAKAAETEEYISDEKKISVTVIDSVYMDSEDASPHIFYKLDRTNCELVMKITGVNEISYPQSFAYHDGKYYVLYISKGDKVQRIVTFGEEKTAFKPKKNLGHANGLTLAEGRFYLVKSGGSEGVSFSPSNSDYKVFKLPYETSGIAYDERAGMFYTSQYSGMTTFNKQFAEVNRFKRISRKGIHYPQDSGAYSGIMMHCVSGPDPQGTNYIDFYDMLHQKYLGSIECDLNEVESLIVNDEGYIELLCNTEEKEDCIWKTPINMKMLCD